MKKRMDHEMLSEVRKKSIKAVMEEIERRIYIIEHIQGNDGKLMYPNFYGGDEMLEMELEYLHLTERYMEKLRRFLPDHLKHVDN
jgi:hypothetical protein